MMYRKAKFSIKAHFYMMRMFGTWIPKGTSIHSRKEQTGNQLPCT